ncbi:DUF6406 domain-containing protein [Plantactinospora sp. CA-294935]|jgi:hypothetical protein|uniref:DUF6406 domain-containing protein n=1 Tax=Plantactinospora sp. CA-294935 TaxID=3240012 RepID=UPI0032628877
MIESAVLRHGRVCNLGVGRVAVHFLSNPALDGEPVRVDLVVVPRNGVEQTLTLREGEQFTVGETAWILEGVENAGTYDYVVRIARAAG